MSAPVAAVLGPPQDQTPIDSIEGFVRQREWIYERDSDSLDFSTETANTTYMVQFRWMPQLDLLTIACTFDLKVPPHRAAEVDLLIRLANQQLWVGHFDRWQEQGTIMFRSSMPVPDTIPTEAQCMQMYGQTIELCEGYYRPLHFVVYGGQSAVEAMRAIDFDTEGSA